MKTSQQKCNSLGFFSKEKRYIIRNLSRSPPLKFTETDISTHHVIPAYSLRLVKAENTRLKQMPQRSPYLRDMGITAMMIVSRKDPVPADTAMIHLVKGQERLIQTRLIRSST